MTAKGNWIWWNLSFHSTFPLGQGRIIQRQLSPLFGHTKSHCRLVHIFFNSHFGCHFLNKLYAKFLCILAAPFVPCWIGPYRFVPTAPMHDSKKRLLPGIFLCGDKQVYNAPDCNSWQHLTVGPSLAFVQD